MSGFGPVSAGRSPVFVRPTTGAVSRPVGYVAYVTVAFSSACVLVPELRVVVLNTRCLAVDTFGCAAAAKWRLRCCLVVLARLLCRCYQGNLDQRTKSNYV